MQTRILVYYTIIQRDLIELLASSNTFFCYSLLLLCVFVNVRDNFHVSYSVLFLGNSTNSTHFFTMSIRGIQHRATN